MDIRQFTLAQCSKLHCGLCQFYVAETCLCICVSEGVHRTCCVFSDMQEEKHAANIVQLGDKINIFTRELSLVQAR